MQRINIKSIRMQNFKGVTDKTISFNNRTIVKGQNASGKTTIADAFSWCLFDKDSQGNTKFQVRPLDAFNHQIDYVDIVVALQMDIDGKPVEIEKTQKQNWVKKRGSAVAELQGNTNSYKVNSVPMKEKEYKEYIAGIVDEDLFKLLTNPMAFTSKKWKEQREVLVSMVDEISDEDVFAMDHSKKYAPLQLALSLHTAEENMAIAKGKMADLKKEQNELPARIDALSKARTDIDVAEQELSKADFKRQVAEVDKQLEDMDATVGEYQAFSDEIMKKKFAMNDLERIATEVLIAQKRDIQKDIDTLDRTFFEQFDKQKKLEKFVSDANEELAIFKNKKSDLTEQWKSEKAKTFDESKWVFDETSLNCSLCGQPLPAEKQEELKATFEHKKKKAMEEFEEVKKLNIDRITESGMKAKQDIEHLEKSIKEAEIDVATCVSEKESCNAKKNALQKEYDAIPNNADMSGNAEYSRLLMEVEEMEKKLATMNSGADFRSQLKIKRNGLMEQLDAVNKIIASADNTKIDEQIAEYEERQKEVGQLVADQEQLLYLLEEFNKEKMKMLSNAINKKFKVVSWKLFDMQLNGGVKECCECMVGGVPYSDLNNGHKIVAGFDIINTLIGLHEVSCPIFLDNAETINQNNIPEIDAQIVELKVSEDREIVVESE